MSRIDELYAKYFNGLVRMLGRNRDADDIAQETLIAAWKRLEQGVPIDNERAYLAQSARNNANKRYSRANVPRHGAGRLTQLDDKHDATDERLNAEDELSGREEVLRFRAEFNAVMAELSDDTQQCVVLRRRGLSTQEIAQRLGLTDQGVRSRLSRSNALFRARLSPPPDVPWLDIFGDDDDHQG
jgi:RNA polymerase sigma factor (sigma-70 family)